MFIKVRIANLKDLSKSISPKDSNIVRVKNDKTKIKTVKKYLFISFVSKFILKKNNLFIKTFLGLLKERIWLSEYLVKE